MLIWLSIYWGHEQYGGYFADNISIYILFKENFDWKCVIGVQLLTDSLGSGN